MIDAGRVLGRHHWLSDTVARSLLGFYWAKHMARHPPAVSGVIPW